MYGNKISFVVVVMYASDKPQHLMYGNRVLGTIAGVLIMINLNI